ncbi:hypothetical protein GCM10020221_29730 [Streptomyces thioluteus]|uniref:Amino acid permease n=1 Tax=Streptomyces thioluteus TaxID=66431 RepID=A0ABN3WYE7_STRTU
MTLTEQTGDERPTATRPSEAAPAASTAQQAVPQQQFISWATLALMTTASVANLRPAPSMALYGLAAVFLYLLPAVVFLLPTALVSAELASGRPGGIYRWVSEGLSKPLGLPRRVVPVRDDHRVLPEPARLRGQHVRVRHRPLARGQRPLRRPRDRRRLLGRAC